MRALGWHAPAHMVLVWRLPRHAAVRRADVLLGVGLQPEHRRLEHGERFDDAASMLVEIACRHAGLLPSAAPRAWSRGDMRLIAFLAAPRVSSLRCLVHVCARLACFGAYGAALTLVPHVACLNSSSVFSVFGMLVAITFAWLDFTLRIPGVDPDARMFGS